VTDRIARLRVRSVLMKAGGAKISVLRTDDFDYAADARAWAAQCIAPHTHDIAGFAFIVWNHDGDSTCKLKANMRSSIPMIMVPDFVRNRLLAERIVDWAVEEMKK
jgi:hypothetical protein